MAYSLFPGYIDLTYQSDKALHNARLPTRNPEGSGGAISYLRWNMLTNIDFDEMVQALVDAWVPSFPTTTTFLDATAYRVPDEDSQAAIPVGFYVVTDGAGTSAGAGVDAAQATWSFMTEGGHQSRLVGLDIAPSTEFRPRRPGGFLAADTDIEAAWTNDLYAWCGRDSTRPTALRRVVFTLNDALRRAYRYT
jgi:hypothetical protein